MIIRVGKSETPYLSYRRRMSEFKEEKLYCLTSIKSELI